jgi:hypothetical protein
MGMSHGYNVSTNPPVWPDVVRCRRELLGRLGPRPPPGGLSSAHVRVAVRPREGLVSKQD